MIEVTNLTKKYGGHCAVQNLSFTVQDGQIYGFLGPNGAGKSTTMNIMTGYLAPTEGDVTINGYNILEEPRKARKSIGYLPEIPPLYPDMTVEEYLRFAAQLKQIPGKQIGDALADAMAKTGLTSMRGRLIRNLSKGYKQRTGLAQAILGSPDVIILDEPMVGLDPKQIIEIRELIRSLAPQHTVILSSHILSEISAVCDHILIISGGKLVASGTPEELTRMMQGGDVLKITVKGTKNQVQRALQSAGIETAVLSVSAEPGCTDLELDLENVGDVREKLFYLFAGERLPILQMARSSVSLEDVFLELTQSEQTDDETEADGPVDAAEKINAEKQSEAEEDAL